MDKTDDGFDPATLAQHFNNPVPRMDLFKDRSNTMTPDRIRQIFRLSRPAMAPPFSPTSPTTSIGR
jgi:hypothetical protein